MTDDTDHKKQPHIVMADDKTNTLGAEIPLDERVADSRDRYVDPDRIENASLHIDKVVEQLEQMSGDDNPFNDHEATEDVTTSNEPEGAKNEAVPDIDDDAVDIDEDASAENTDGDTLQDTFASDPAPSDNDVISDPLDSDNGNVPSEPDDAYAGDVKNHTVSPADAGAGDTDHYANTDSVPEHPSEEVFQNFPPDFPEDGWDAPTPEQLADYEDQQRRVALTGSDFRGGEGGHAEVEYSDQDTIDGLIDAVEDDVDETGSAPSQRRQTPSNDADDADAYDKVDPEDLLAEEGDIFPDDDLDTPDDAVIADYAAATDEPVHPDVSSGDTEAPSRGFDDDDTTSIDDFLDGDEADDRDSSTDTGGGDDGVGGTDDAGSGEDPSRRSFARRLAGVSVLAIGVVGVALAGTIALNTLLPDDQAPDVADDSDAETEVTDETDREDDFAQDPDDGDLADLMDPQPAEDGDAPDVVDDGFGADDDDATAMIDEMFGRDPEEEPDTTEVDDGTITFSDEQLELLASAEDIDTLIEMFESSEARISDLEDAVSERDLAIEERDEILLEMAERLSETEAMAMATNEVLTDVVRLQESAETAEELIVDLSQRLAHLEGQDPADRVAIERRLDDVDDRIQSMARDLGLLARMVMTDDGPRAFGQPTAPVPGGASVFEDAADKESERPGAPEIPSDVATGDMVDGYGEVLDIMSTSDGGQLVVMENGSVIVE